MFIRMMPMDSMVVWISMALLYHDFRLISY